MTYEQNVKAILESNFAGFKEEIIDVACKRICMLETEDETLDRVLEIIDEEIEDSKTDSDNRLLIGVRLHNVKSAVMVLKGGES